MVGLQLVFAVDKIYRPLVDEKCLKMYGFSNTINRLIGGKKNNENNEKCFTTTYYVDNLDINHN